MGVSDASQDAVAERRIVVALRAAGGEVTGAFGARVRSVLGGAVSDVGPVADRAPGQRPGLQPTAGRRVPVAVWVTGRALLVAAGFFWWQRAKPTPDLSGESAARRSAPPTPEKSVAPVISAKSIAVLPLTTMSDDKDATALFADGMPKDILTNLAKIAELKVISRPSVMP